MLPARTTLAQFAVCSRTSGIRTTFAISDCSRLTIAGGVPAGAKIAFLVKERSITDELRAKLLGWRYCGGFSAHHQVRVGAHDAEGRKKLAGYRIRAPMSLEKMSYDAATGTVIYRSKMHEGLKRNFQVMPGAEWLELLCKHIPDRYEHLVRYVGWYSNRARGERAKALKMLNRNCSRPRPGVICSGRTARQR